MAGFLQTFIEDYIWYHAVTLIAVIIIAVLVYIHHAGSEQNLNVVKEYKAVLDPFLIKHFSDYDGETLVESPNIIKLYPSGRDSCLFAIFAFAVTILLISLCLDSKSSPISSTRYLSS
jgi:hypothetical protein